jgi:protein gp37
MGKSKIEWTDVVWNPVVGCSKVSDGCKNCYAERMTARFRKDYLPWTLQNAAHNVVLRPAKLNEPRYWKKPRRIFVNSMSDLFHEQVPDEFIYSVFQVMTSTPWHTYQVLTKRPERMQRLVSESAPNIWLGVSVEDQRAADERIPILLQTPAAVRFLSCEPLLGPIDLAEAGNNACVEWWENRGIDWVIVGGESGPGARPMHPDWARSLRDQCLGQAQFFFKQWGEWIGDSQIQRDNPMQWPRFGKVHFGGLNVRGEWHEGEYSQPMGECMYRVGKFSAGRLLDGRTWDEMPDLTPSPSPTRGGEQAERGVCQVCGCTDMRACPGGCSWVNDEHTLCSKCAEVHWEVVK